MAMADLARQRDGRPVALADIADRQDISLSYLEQLFGKLRRGAQVKSVRGPGGGYMLARPVDEMRVSDIILAVDETIKATRCTPGSPSGCQPDRSRCLTHDLWEELGNQIHLFLSSVTLGDIINNHVLGRSGQTFIMGNGGPLNTDGSPVSGAPFHAAE
jgi:Rrf2 family iron-sulfur cluster assembly transcriptional regulator